MSFSPYVNRRINLLSSDIGEPINCVYDPNGLPHKVVFIHDLAAKHGVEDEPTNLKMMIVAGNGGNALKAYLTEKLGLKAGVDFARHGMGMRGGLKYFDIGDEAIVKLFARAEEVGAASAAEREHRRASAPSEEPRR